MEKAIRNYVTAFALISKVPTDFVFDENKSVKWNREQAEKHNEQYMQANDDWHMEKHNCLEQAENEIIEAMQAEAEYDMTKAEAECIWRHFNEGAISYNDPAALEYELWEMINFASELYFSRIPCEKKSEDNNND